MRGKILLRAVALVLDKTGVKRNEHARLHRRQIHIVRLHLAPGNIADIEHDAPALGVIQRERFVHHIKMGTK